MQKDQRFRYEMFVRVRDYGTAQKELFPESSTGGQTFAQVTAAVAAIDGHLTDRVVATAEAQRVKAATRAAVFDYMKNVAQTARRVTRSKPGPNRFRMPRRKSLNAEISAARAFIREAEPLRDEFVRFGLPPTFISDFQGLVDAFQQAVDVRLNSKTLRRQAQAGIVTVLAQSLDVIRDLDAVVANATRHDPIRFAAYQSARRIEGLGSSSTTAVKPPVVPPVAVPPDSANPPAPPAATTTALALLPAPEEVLGRAS